jgi:polar amino acid transport system permease protein
MFFASKSKNTYLRSLVDVYTNIMFGTPLLVVVIIFYFFIGAAVAIDSVLFWGITSMTMYFAPFMMKLFISAYRAIDENQFIVCDIFGFSKFQMYRYIIIPQMLKIMLPPLSGQLSIIIKGSSLLYVTGFNELFYNLSTIQSKTYAYPEGYILIMVLYLIITIPLIKVTEYLERRLTV